MIRAIQGYNTNFTGLKNLKPQKMARKVVNANEKMPKGLSSPVRCQDVFDDMEKAINDRFDNSNIFEKSLATIASSGALTYTIDTGFLR